MGRERGRSRGGRRVRPRRTTPRKSRSRRPISQNPLHVLHNGRPRCGLRRAKRPPSGPRPRRAPRTSCRRSQRNTQRVRRRQAGCRAQKRPMHHHAPISTPPHTSHRRRHRCLQGRTMCQSGYPRRRCALQTQSSKRTVRGPSPTPRHGGMRRGRPRTSTTT